MKQSPLHRRHLEEGGKLVPFAGWEMPIQYSGIVAEHQAVRTGVGVFDISHMGELFVSGAGSEKGLNRLLTNQVGRLSDGEGQYTLMLNDEGGVIDDLILYRISEDSFFLVVNASRVQEDFEWIKARLDSELEVKNQSDDWGALAIQGPGTVDLWEKLATGVSLPERNGIVRNGDNLILCRTGYTGEDGFELFSPASEIESWWNRIRSAGATACGLGARDTLRLEKGYPLNGNDLDRARTPLEAGLGFFVDLQKEGGFVGAEILAEQKDKGLSERLVGIQMARKGPPPRHGYEVRDESGDTRLGELSSGSLSPTLGLGIGMAYLETPHARVGTPLTLVIRDRIYPAEVVKKPFYRKASSVGT